MTREEAIKVIRKMLAYTDLSVRANLTADMVDACHLAIKILEQEPCEDAISRQEVLYLIADHDLSMGQVVKGIHALSSVTPQPKMGHCKDCKWWKDSDGVYRRGVGAESQCPINRKEVYEGNGYCFLYEPQKSEDKE